NFVAGIGLFWGNPPSLRRHVCARPRLSGRIAHRDRDCGNRRTILPSVAIEETRTGWPMNPVLAAISIRVKIGAKTLLDYVSVAVHPGETVALIGPNGAGKTTLLRVLSGELKPPFATVRLKGRELSSYGARALAEHRSMLSQHLTVAF